MSDTWEKMANDAVKEQRNYSRVSLSHGVLEVTWPTTVTRRDVDKIRRLVSLIEFDCEAEPATDETKETDQ